jgi:hypothetical protein
MAETESTLLESKTTTPEHVLFQEVAGNSVLLNTETETYFELDDVGTRMWQSMEQAATIAAAARALAEIYDAPIETLERDIVRLAVELRDHGLLEIGG